MYSSSGFVFIHIPRTGGTSLGETLTKYIDYKYPVHTSANYIMQDIGADIFFRCKRFAVVRNSWDRIHSLYYQIGNTKETFEKFLDGIYTGNVWWSCSQLALITNTDKYHDRCGRWYDRKFDTSIIVDKIFYYKKVMLQEIADYLEMDLKFNPHRNYVHRPDYRKVYTQKTKDIVRRLYADEIDIFRFKFDE